MEKIFNHKKFNYFVWTPLGSRVNYYINFCLQVVDTIGKIATGVNSSPVSLTPVANLPQVLTTLAKLVAKFDAGVIDTSGIFAASVVDTGVNFAAGVPLTPVVNLPPVSLIPACTLTCKYLCEFLKKFETVLMGYSGVGN
jgi:hypothetical protein